METNLSIAVIDMVPIKSPIVLGALLRETRTALHLPAADMAALVKTTPVSLRRLEQGKATGAINTLFALLDELGLQLHVSLPPGVESIQLPDEQSKPRRTRVKP